MERLKNYLKHKREEMTMEDLVNRLRIEEDSRKSKKKTPNTMVAKANVVEAEKNNKQKWEYNPNAKKPNNIKGIYHNCGNKGHKASECRGPKKKKE